MNVNKAFNCQSHPWILELVACKHFVFVYFPLDKKASILQKVSLNLASILLLKLANTLQQIFYKGPLLSLKAKCHFQACFQSWAFAQKRYKTQTKPKELKFFSLHKHQQIISIPGWCIQDFFQRKSWEVYHKLNLIHWEQRAESREARHSPTSPLEVSILQENARTTFPLYLFSIHYFRYFRHYFLIFFSSHSNKQEEGRGNQLLNLGVFHKP